MEIDDTGNVNFLTSFRRHGLGLNLCDGIKGETHFSGTWS